MNKATVLIQTHRCLKC